MANFSVLRRSKAAVVANRRATINISQETKDALDSIKHSGQSYNGLIQELVKFWKDKKADYWTRRKAQKK